MANVTPIRGEQPRVAPHNVEVEQALLGAILMNNDAFFRVDGFLKAEHFNEPLHQKIFELLASLISAGKLANPVTVKTFLPSDMKIGPHTGPQYLARLAAEATSVINAEDYGQTICDLAIRRDLVSIGDMICSAAYEAPPDVSAREQVEFAETALFNINHTEVHRGGYEPFARALTKSIDMAAQAYQRDGKLSGLPTGLSDLDAMMGGLQASDLIVLAGRPGSGKEQPVDTLVHTPAGWRCIGELAPGDFVTGRSGKPTKVVSVHPQGVKQAYRISFRDGTSTECGLDHLWSVARSDGRSRLLFQTVTTQWLINEGVRRPKKGNRKGAKFRIPLVLPIERPEATLPIDPYVLGVMIGDGCMVNRSLRFSNPEMDSDIRTRVEARIKQYDLGLRGNWSGQCPYFELVGEGRSDFKEKIKALGLAAYSANKFIPDIYLMASVSQRMDLLRGLMDTDGGAMFNGGAAFYSTSLRLAEGVVDVVRSLGGLAIIRSYDRSHCNKPTEHRVNVKMEECPFYTERKISRWVPQKPSRYIWSIEKSRICEQVCILVEADDHLYVANDYIVTHNTALATNVAYYLAKNKELQENGVRAIGGCVGFASLEMSDEQLATRIVAEQTEIPSYRMRRGDIDPADFDRMAMTAREMERIPLYIDSAGGLNIKQIAQRARRLKRQRGLDLLVVDYIQLVAGSKQAMGYGQNRVQEVTEVTIGLKSLAKELNIPILALSQLSRAVENREDKRPQLSDLRESGCLAGDTLIVDPATGSRRRIDALCGDEPNGVLAMDGDLKVGSSHSSRGFCTGSKPVFELTLKTGRKITATANHKFLTQRGWMRLDQLLPSDHVATPRNIPPCGRQTLMDDELILLGHMIGDGCALKDHALQYTAGEMELAELVSRAAKNVFGDRVNPRINSERTWFQVYLAASERLTHGVKNPVGEWMGSFGLWDKRSHEKFIPEQIFAQGGGGQLACSWPIFGRPTVMSGLGRRRKDSHVSSTRRVVKR